MIKYEILSSGSKGNAVIINDHILIDCGVPFKVIEPYLQNLSLVLLTHIHSDHFYETTIKKMAGLRPMLRFGCCNWLVPELLKARVPQRNIDVYDINFNGLYTYKDFVQLSPVPLFHNVPNCGYKLFLPEGKLFYATDTNSLYGIEAKDFDLYMIEANHGTEEIQKRIREKQSEGIYSYEVDAMKNHLSKEKCDQFLVENAGPTSQFIYMHCHAGLESEF